jgi:hypothetical protein
MQRIFLSHENEDRVIIRRVQRDLLLMGAEPFFDELSILNDEVPSNRIEAALETVDMFVLFWSATAAASAWVTAERLSAWSKFQAEEQRFLIVVLDDTPLPASLAHKQYIDGKTEDARGRIAREVLGPESGAQFIKGVQGTLEACSIDIAFSEGYGLYAGCPKCGAGVAEMTKLTVPDCRYETVYGYLRCTRCRWLGGGGEVDFN